MHVIFSSDAFAELSFLLFVIHSARRKWLQNYEKLRVQVAQLGRDRGTVPAVLGVN